MSPLRVVQALAPEDFKQLLALARSQYRHHPIPFQLFALLILNLAIAPAVAAATGPDISRKAAYALAALGLVILGLAIYLFVVIFQPERF